MAPLVDLHIICLPGRDPEKAIESCRHPGVRLWIADSTGPQIGKQRADLIAQGSAPLVAHCDDDDEWLPGGLDALMSAWDPNGGHGGIYGDEERLRADGTRMVYGGPWSLRSFLTRKSGPHNGILYDRRRLTPHLPLLREHDAGTSILLTRAMAPFQYVAEIVYRWNQHATQTSRTRSDMQEWANRARQATAEHMRSLYRSQAR